MEHKGMVHALQEIRRLLKPDGVLIDIHPVPDAPLFEVRRDGRVLHAEPEPGHDFDEDIRQADRALARALKRRLFTLESRREFDFLTYGSTVQELLDFMEEARAFHGDADGEQATPDEEAFFAQLEQHLRRAGADAQVATHERGQIARLKPVR
jgi:SAM-dependent methyltransferase